VQRDFDVVVIGGGPAGEVAAGRLAERGKLTVALIEDRLVGGECSFWACMPSKALLRPAEALRELRRVPGAAQTAHGRPDVAAVLARRDEVIHNLDDEAQLPWLRSRHIELIRGHARIEGERRVRVGEMRITAQLAVLVATGSDAAVPPVPGLAELDPWSNREITTARQAPESLAILGGGAVGVEMADAWSSLGSEVTLIETLPRLLAREEPFAGEQVAAALGRRGVTIHLGARVTRAERAPLGGALILDDGARVESQRILVAAGRTPRTRDLGIETLGMRPGDPIEVDDHLRVPGLPWLYAVGDVNGRSLLTHSGKYQARIAADHLLGAEGATASVDTAGPPRVVFSDPQVAAVGRTLALAHEAGLNATAIDLETSGTAGASFWGRGSEGTTRFVVDCDREVLVGATFVGPDVAEFVQAATVAIVGEVPLRRLAHAVAPFPTRSELWLNFLQGYEHERDTTVHATPL
jgi:pyruvate/2-oxoglutarate dehydrogenase complex dihydrolipoamide dehydrogenase (E3) component